MRTPQEVVGFLRSSVPLFAGLTDERLADWAALLDALRAVAVEL